MSQRRFFTSLMLVMAGSQLGGCGTHVPELEEVWESVDVKGDMEFRIKKHIFCEMRDALREVRRNIRVNGQAAIPNDYGVQMQINLTVDEVNGFNPSVGYQDIMHNGLGNGITVPQSFSVNATATVSADATRTDTIYSYYNVGKVAADNVNTWCSDPKLHNREGSSLLLQSNLGIADYLKEAVKGADLLASSAPASGGAGKTAKYDVYSYDMKFVVVTSGGISPVWKLVSVNAGAGNLPLLNAGRTRTHELILTFGPGTNQPTDFAQQTHFVNQIVQSNRQRSQRSGF